MYSQQDHVLPDLIEGDGYFDIHLPLQLSAEAVGQGCEGDTWFFPPHKAIVLSE